MATDPPQKSHGFKTITPVVTYAMGFWGPYKHYRGDCLGPIFLGGGSVAIISRCRRTVYIKTLSTFSCTLYLSTFAPAGVLKNK
jgi:hypothetical protein